MSEIVDCINSLSAKDIIRSVAKTANGVPFYLQTSGLGGFSVEYQAIYDAFPTKPPDSVAAVQNTMVVNLITSGVWPKLDIFYVLANDTQANSLINWINPGTFDSTLFGAPAFTSYEGFLGANNNHIVTNYNPSTNGINYGQDDVSFGVYSRTAGILNKIEMGATDGSQALQIKILYVGTTMGGDVNDFTFRATADASNTGLGMSALDRSASDRFQMITNGVNIGPGITNSVGEVNDVVTILSFGGAATSTLRQLSLGWMGGSMTAPQHLSLRNEFETYMASNGKGVRP